MTSVETCVTTLLRGVCWSSVIFLQYCSVIFLNISVFSVVCAFCDLSGDVNGCRTRAVIIYTTAFLTITILHTTHHLLIYVGDQ